MNPALAQQPGVLRFNLSLPSTRIRLGPIVLDGMEALLGVSLSNILDPLMPSPRFSRNNAQGAEVDVYPLAIPDGEGFSVPIKHIGEIGARNFRSYLILILPPGLAEVMRDQLAEDIAAKRAAGPRPARGTNGGLVVEFAIALRPGMRKVIPLGQYGELGVEAA
ncbi:MAG: hypothetical protein IPI35_24675 [Deltaproteobacteria bacterium]|nr:hypothetical protein [Deltaproteobacteria bacterium]